MEDVCKECVGMDFDAKEIILNNERRLKIGMKYNQSSIFYFFPEFIQSEIINHCLEIISNEDHIPTLNPRHISFSVIVSHQSFTIRFHFTGLLKK